MFYTIAPKTAHRFVGYLEEEAVHTYTKVVDAIDAGNLPQWANMKAPAEAIEYYSLDPETATMRDVIVSIRADEAVHRSVNHHFSDVPQFYDIKNEKIHLSTGGLDHVDEEKL